MTSSYPSGFQPNFNSEFSVTIQRPLSTVFSILGTNEGLGAHILLSSLASDFEALARDAVAVDGNLEDAFVRTAAAGEGLPRQSFTYKETVKIITGLSFLDSVIHIRGTFTWDEQGKVALYESLSDTGVLIRKIRRFEEVDGGAATQISEKVYGQGAPLLRFINQWIARAAHKEQMNRYSTLFE
ncbi:hypothetical protein FB451DRAFT_600289 [Mycena latifolia]|nr:hypothetical protein FB451DRAFT_600289 [Mycena latifolia]